MDLLHLYGIQPAFLDLLFSLYSLGAVVVAGILTLCCSDMIMSNKRNFFVILMVAVVWYIPVYKTIKFVLVDWVETRRGRRLAKLRARRNT